MLDKKCNKNDADYGIEKYNGSFEQDDLGVTQIPTETIRTLRNMNDLALFTFLASCSKTWKLNVKFLAAHFDCNKEKIYKTIDSLIALGFLTRTQPRNKGKFGKYHYRLHLRQLNLESPRPEKPDPEKPYTVNPDTYKTNILPLENIEVITTTVFCEITDKEILALKQKHLPSDARTPQEFLNECKYHVEHGKKEFSPRQRIAGLKKLIRSGYFETPGGYSKTKKKTEINNEARYSTYWNGIKSDIALGLIPKNTKILPYQEWIVLQ